MSIIKPGDSPYPDSPKNLFGPMEIADEKCTDADRSYKNKGWECVWDYGKSDSQQRALEAVKELDDAGIQAFIVEVPNTDIRRIWANPPK